MDFDYVKLPLDKPSPIVGTAVLRPIIPVTLTALSNSLDYAVLVDSGADYCIFHSEIGEALGINVSKGEKEAFNGVQDNSGSPAVGYVHPIDLTIGGWRYSIQVVFSNEISKAGYGIVGQKGFFERYVVKFDYTKGKIELREQLPGR